MKTLKLFLYIILIAVLSFSAAFNILLLNTTYGTLAFKYNEEKLASMILSETESRFVLQDTTTNFYVTSDQIKLVEGKGYLLKYSRVTKEGLKESHEYHVYMDEEDGFTYYYKTVDFKDNEIKRYFVDSTLYTNTNGIKVRESLTLQPEKSNVMLEVTDFYNQPLYLLNGISLKLFTDVNTSLDFSVSPLYVLGIKATFKTDIESHSLHFDLKGNLRKSTKIDAVGTKTTITISEKNEPVEFPDLFKFVLKK